jgi:hypothetical protein
MEVSARGGQRLRIARAGVVYETDDVGYAIDEVRNE